MDGAPAMIAGGVECVSQIRTRDDGVSGLIRGCWRTSPSCICP